MSLNLGWLIALPLLAILIPICLYILALVVGSILALGFWIYDKLIGN